MAKKYPNLYLRGGIYYYRFKRAGQDFDGSTHTHVVTEAQRILREMISKAEAGELVKAPGRTPGAARISVSFAEMRDHDLQRARKCSHSDEIVNTGVGLSWKRLEPFFEDAYSITHASVTKYAVDQLRRGYSSSTIKRDVWTILRGYKFARYSLMDLPILPDDLAKMVASPCGNQKGEVIAHKKLEAMVALLHPKAAIKLIIAVTTGLRRKELSRLDPAWYRTESYSRAPAYFIDMPAWATKNKVERTIPISSRVWALLQHFDAFKVDYRTPWRTAGSKVGVHSLALRDLRHTFSDTMSPVDAVGVEKIMDHKLIGPMAHRYQKVGDERLTRIARQVEREMPWLKNACERLLQQVLQ